MFRRAAGLAFLLMSAASVLGCGKGLSAEDAKLRCDQERIAKNCVTPAAYDACTSCYEECGDSCFAGAACPESYTCNDGSSDGTTSSTGSGGTGGSK